jgi:outer membrane protein assembly factor BamB
VSGSRVFVTVGQAQPNGQNHAVAYALDEASGSILWGPIDLSDTGRSDPTYDSGRIFVMTFSAHLLALDASTGAVLWNKAMPDGQYLADAPPTAANGTVYAAASGFGGTLYAFRETDGSLIWSQSVETADQDAPTVTADSVYVSYVCDDAYDFATSDGGARWEDRNQMGCGGAGGKTAPLADGKLFTRADEPMQILDAATGSVLGTFSSMFIPAVAGGVMFTTPDYTLAAVPEGSSTPTWTFGGPSTNPVYGAPLVVGDQVVVGTGSALYVLSASDGSVTSSTPLASILGPDEQNASAPLAGLTEADGMLFVPAGTAIVAY